MSAREEILRRVRAALDGVERDFVVPEAPRITPVPDLVTLFAERVADYRATVRVCVESELTQTVLEAIPPGARVVIPEDLPVEVPDAVVDDGLSAAQLDDLDVVVTASALGIAETGTIVLDHGPGQGRRAISLVPDHHVCIVRADRIVPDVPDAMALLDPTRPRTWVSGPSATSDIELSRVEGVHGPRRLHVLVVQA